MTLRAVLSICTALALNAPTHATPAPPAPPIVLDNGVRVILIPVPGATRVGVEVVHHVGSLHEPADMPQLAHLVEHLTCYGATGSQREGEAFAIGQARGSVNAETLADATRYEHEAPAEDLERILKLEADRLKGVTFTPALLAQESPRIDQEAAFVDASPMAPLMKYAFVAAPQAWFYNSKDVALSGATKSFDLNAAAAWRTRWYRPDLTTIVIVGGFEPDAALKLVREIVGAVPKPPGNGIPARGSWPDTPRRDTVKWTSKHTGLIVAFNPAVDEAERLALTLLGDLALERLARDPEVQKVALVSMCSNRAWPVGSTEGVGGLPLFIYATLKPGQNPVEQERVLTDRFIAAMQDAAASDMLGALAVSLEPQPVPTWDQLQAQGRQAFTGRPGLNADPGGMMLMFHALQAAVRDRVAGDAKAIEGVKRMRPEGVRGLLSRVMSAQRKFVTVLTP